MELRRRDCAPLCKWEQEENAFKGREENGDESLERDRRGAVHKINDFIVSRFLLSHKFLLLYWVGVGINKLTYFDCIGLNKTLV